ncbi:MAG: peptidylprolyl isomerase [Lachnospiraceae bacterium]|nr:peptidylprolyl isomerase [Lachnospiraceae bacterium]
MKKFITMLTVMIMGCLLLAGCGDPGYMTAAELEAENTRLQGEAEARLKEQEAKAEAEREKQAEEAAAANAEKKAELGITSDIYADIIIKDYGTITVKLDFDAAPLTVANFMKLAESGFYDGLTFHRIMKGFMMQGGDPLGNGGGGSDENIIGEFESNGYHNPISHVRGVISMARANDPNSASSQFFIVHQDSTFLDGNYAGFGMVTEGMDVVDAVCEVAQPVDDNGTILAEEQPVIEKIVIRK